MIEYRLGDAAATHRARAAAVAGAVTSLAPVLLGVVLLQRMGWGAPSRLLWPVGAALATLVGVRVAVGYATARRRLRALVVTVNDEGISVDVPRDGYVIERGRVARIVEIDGPLGGVRVESKPDPRNGAVFVAHVPRGGATFGEVRACLERWLPIERRGRRGPAMRFALGALVVAGIFFVPFLLDDFVAHSKLVAAALIVGMWLVMRAAVRGR